MKVHGPNLHEPIWTLMKQIESLIWTLHWTFICILVIQIVISSLIYVFCSQNQFAIFSILDPYLKPLGLNYGS
jgi:uncharacterized protein YggT (Ycf19 family)